MIQGKHYQIGDTYYLQFDNVTFSGNTREELQPRADKFFYKLKQRASAYPLALAYAKQGKMREAYNVIGE